MDNVSRVSKGAALVTLIAFCCASCIQPLEYPPPPPAKSVPNNGKKAEAVWFFFNDLYQPADKFTNKIGLAIVGDSGTKDVIVAAEKLDRGGYAVYVCIGSQTCASMYFEDTGFFPKPNIVVSDGDDVSRVEVSDYADGKFNAVFQTGTARQFFIGVPLGDAARRGCAPAAGIGEEQRRRVEVLLAALDVWSGLGSCLNTIGANSVDGGSRFGPTPAAAAVFDVKAVIAAVRATPIALPIALTAALNTTAAVLGIVSSALFAGEALFDFLEKKQLVDEVQLEKEKKTVFVYVSVSIEDYDGDIRDLVKEGSIGNDGTLANLSKLEFPNENSSLRMPKLTITISVPGEGDALSLAENRVGYDANAAMTNDFSFATQKQTGVLRLTKIERLHAGFDTKGTMPIVFYFGKDVVINSNPNGISYKNPYVFVHPYTSATIAADTNEVQRKDMFVLNIVNPQRNSYF